MGKSVSGAERKKNPLKFTYKGFSPGGMHDCSGVFNFLLGFPIFIFIQPQFLLNLCIILDKYMKTRF